MTPDWLKVAIVGSDLPYPPTAGNRIRTLNLAGWPASRITFIAHRNAESAEASRFLHKQGIDTHLVDCRPSAKSRALLRPVELTWRLLYLILRPPRGRLRIARSPPISTPRKSMSGRSKRWFSWNALADIEGQPKVLHNVEPLIWQRYHEHEPDVLAEV